MTSGGAKVPKADRVRCNMLDIGYYRSWPNPAIGQWPRGNLT